MEIVKLHHFATHINLHNFTFSLAVALRKEISRPLAVYICAK